MKSTQNKTDNSSCSTDMNEVVRNRSNSSFDSTNNQGDLKEVKNQGDLRDVTGKGGSKDRYNMTNT